MHYSKSITIWTKYQIIFIPALCILHIHDKYKYYVYKKRQSKHPKEEEELFSVCKQLDSYLSIDSRYSTSAGNQRRSILDSLTNKPVLLTDFDHEVMANMGVWYNKPLALLKIYLPAISCLLLCCALYYLNQFYIIKCMWPHLAARPNINSAVTCFLVPAGLVYALSFGFMFQQCMEKQRIILLKVTREMALIDHIITLAGKLNLQNKQYLLVIYR